MLLTLILEGKNVQTLDWSTHNDTGDTITHINLSIKEKKKKKEEKKEYVVALFF